MTSSGGWLSTNGAALTTGSITNFTMTADGTIISNVNIGGQINMSEEVPGQMTFDEVVSNEFINAAGQIWEVCCEHCECEAGERFGHDDTCRWGCND